MHIYLLKVRYTISYTKSFATRQMSIIWGGLPTEKQEECFNESIETGGTKNSS